MTTPRTPDTAPDFWRCSRCATPNPSASYITHCVGCGAVRTARSEPRPNATVEKRRWWPPRPLDRRARWVLGLTLAYCAVIVGLFAVVRLFAEAWLPATLFLFSPRAIMLVPVAVLVGLALWCRRPALLCIDAALVGFIAGPFMGLSLPFSTLLGGTPAGTTVRIMSLNQAQEPLNHAALRALIREQGINVICFQEGRNQTALAGADAEGWNFDSTGLIASRFPIVEELATEDPDAFAERMFWPLNIKRVKIRLPDGRRCMIVCIHMATMRTGFNYLKNGEVDAAYRYQDWRWKQMSDLIGRLAEGRDVPVIVGGDFNMPSDSPMMATLQRQFRDAFREAGWGYGYTRPTDWPFVGIDHILVSPEWDVRHCWVGPDVGSDHLPLLAEVVLPTAAPASD